MGASVSFVRSRRAGAQRVDDILPITIAELAGQSDRLGELLQARSGQGSATSVLHILSRTAPAGAVLERRIQWLTEVHRS